MNIPYKRLFREAYLVYESASDDHIRELHKTLAADAWKPSHATRLYLPKPSGLQRPLSLLKIEDQILLQAVANKFATRLRKKRQLVELKTVFSSKLNSPKNSIFFMERWQTTYSAFQDKCTKLFDNGFRWSAELDLSAYYDTISHDLLLSIASSNENEKGTQEIKKWFRVWSAESDDAMTGHGIPQGPVASNFLADAFFLPLDIKLQKQKKLICYLRYVDDIRLFGKSENEVRTAVIRVEQECRHRGLVPQGQKFLIRKLRTPKDAMGSLPSIAPTDGRDTSENLMSIANARKILATATGGRPLTVTDKSRFRYVMYRAPEDQKILDKVIKLLPRHPEHIDAFIGYFSNCGKRPRIARAALDYLESDVLYSYVRGELWHVVARLGGLGEMTRGLAMARADAKTRKQCVALSCGVMHFLMKCEEMGLTRNSRRLQSEHPISRSLLAPTFNGQKFSHQGHIITLLKGEMMEQLAGARQLQEKNIKLNYLGLRQRDLPKTCVIALKSLGVIRRQYSQRNQDWVGKHLLSLYGCKQYSIWHELLGTEYEHALQILIEAKGLYDGHYSEWLGLQDSFFNIVIPKFFEFLEQKELQEHSKIYDKNGVSIDYGRLISENSAFDERYPVIAKSLRTIHKRRNSIPNSHPYSKKGGARNKWLRRPEQQALILDVKNACDAIAKIFDDNK